MKDRSILVPALAAVVGFAIFAGLVWLMYELSGHFTPADQTRVDERMEILREVQARAGEELLKPAWINREQGVVRLPVERAMELTVQELQAKPVVRKGVAEPIPSNILPPPSQAGMPSQP